MRESIAGVFRKLLLRLIRKCGDFLLPMLIKQSLWQCQRDIATLNGNTPTSIDIGICACHVWLGLVDKGYNITRK